MEIRRLITALHYLEILDLFWFWIDQWKLSDLKFKRSDWLLNFQKRKQNSVYLKIWREKLDSSKEKDHIIILNESLAHTGIKVLLKSGKCLQRSSKLLTLCLLNCKSWLRHTLSKQVVSQKVLYLLQMWKRFVLLPRWSGYLESLRKP